MLPILERELIDNRKWVQEDELLDYYAIGQSTPGIIAVNVATFCGHKLGGISGAVSATLGMIAPSIIIITILAYFISTIEQIPLIVKAMRGINAAVAANLSYSVINLGKKSIKKLWHFGLFLISFALIFFVHVTPVIIIFSSIALGVIIYFIQNRNLEAQNDSDNA